jgi:hypothetical protein
MSLFANLSTAGLEETSDRLGGFAVLESGILTGTIKAMYAGASTSGARFIALIVMAGSKEYKETVYITNKKGENFFLNKQDNSKKVPLPGFITIDDICLCTSGKPLAEQSAEDKVVELYDGTAQKMLPTSVPMLVDCLGKEISLGILKQLVNKNVKDSTGNYVATAETKEENTIDKVFHTESRMTTVEARNGAAAPAFWAAWEEKNKGVTRDKRTVKDGQGGAVAGAPPQANGTTAPAGRGTSLFGNKK